MKKKTAGRWKCDVCGWTAEDYYEFVDHCKEHERENEYKQQRREEDGF